MKKFFPLATYFTLLIISFFFSTDVFSSQKAIDNHQTFGDYSVHYALFNSTFIQPDIAAIHNLKRSKYENIINLSVYKKGNNGTVPAKIHGSSKNLMQQLKDLNIIEVKEESAIYYLIPFRISYKEILHFDFEVTPQGTDKALNVKFSKTVYPE